MLQPAQSTTGMPLSALRGPTHATSRHLITNFAGAGSASSGEPEHATPFLFREPADATAKERHALSLPPNPPPLSRKYTSEKSPRSSSLRKTVARLHPFHANTCAKNELFGMPRGKFKFFAAEGQKLAERGFDPRTFGL